MLAKEQEAATVRSACSAVTLACSARDDSILKTKSEKPSCEKLAVLMVTGIETVKLICIAALSKLCDEKHVCLLASLTCLV